MTLVTTPASSQYVTLHSEMPHKILGTPSSAPNRTQLFLQIWDAGSTAVSAPSRHHKAVITSSLCVVQLCICSLHAETTAHWETCRGNPWLSSRIQESGRQQKKLYTFLQFSPRIPPQWTQTRRTLKIRSQTTILWNPSTIHLCNRYMDWNLMLY